MNPIRKLWVKWRAYPGRDTEIAAVTGDSPWAEVQMGSYCRTLAQRLPDPSLYRGACRWYTRAALRGDGIDEMRELLSQQPDLVFPFDRLLSRAEAGEVEAQLLLAVMYEQGFSCEVSLATAYRYLRQAAESGSIVAQDRLQRYDPVMITGCLHDTAEGRTEALERLKRIWTVRPELCELSAEVLQRARHGDHEMQLQVAVCREQGLGCRMRPRSAAQWYRRAARSRHFFPDNGPCLWVKRAREKLIVEAEEPRQYGNVVRRYFLAAAEGEPRAVEGLRFILLRKPALVQPSEELTNDADPEAQLRLAVAYDYGLGVRASPEEALLWYQRAKRSIPSARARYKQLIEDFACGRQVVTVRGYRAFVQKTITFEGKVLRCEISDDGHYCGILFEDGDWSDAMKIIFTYEAVDTLGGWPPACTPGCTVRAFGKLVRHPRYGWEIRLDDPIQELD